MRSHVCRQLLIQWYGRKSAATLSLTDNLRCLSASSSSRPQVRRRTRKKTMPVQQRITSVDGNPSVAAVPDPIVGESTTSKLLTQDRPVSNEIDPVQFRIKAEEFLKELDEKLRPMQDWNEYFEILLRPSVLEVQLRPDLGAFALNIDYEQLTLELTSPKSGTFTYIYCLEKERWRGKDDGHDLKGMLVRDIIQLCNGVPDL